MKGKLIKKNRQEQEAANAKKPAPPKDVQPKESPVRKPDAPASPAAPAATTEQKAP